jgi:hypothetical protein
MDEDATKKSGERKRRAQSEKSKTETGERRAAKHTRNSFQLSALHIFAF